MMAVGSGPDWLLWAVRRIAGLAAQLALLVSCPVIAGVSVQDRVRGR
jgi:hypothetical protein